MQYSSDLQNPPDYDRQEGTDDAKHTDKLPHTRALRNMSCSVPKRQISGNGAASALAVIYSCFYMYVLHMNVEHTALVNMNYVYYLAEQCCRCTSFISHHYTSNAPFSFFRNIQSGFQGVVGT